MLLLFTCALALGVWRHYEQHRQVTDTAEQQANFVPSVRVEAVAQRFGRLHVTLPATTLGFVEANIYARASGYVLKRYVDIGDHVKAGQLLAEITAPEVEDQIAQYQNSLQQAHQTRDQNQAQQSLDQVTWGRELGPCQSGLGDEAAGRRRSVHLTGPAARDDRRLTTMPRRRRHS